jgi:hypothetical protein
MADQPLVYVGHPIMVVGGAQPDQSPSLPPLPDDKVVSEKLHQHPPNQAINHINHLLANSHCRATWVSCDHPGLLAGCMLQTTAR